MGTLAHFNLAGIAKLHGLKHFVETGTAQGDGLALAAAAPFASLHSIEIVEDLATAAKARFASDQRINIWQGDSRDMLAKILDVLPAEPCLFWLDAHFPGAHSGAAYDAEKDGRVRLPLAEELALIRERRPNAGDVFLLDDMRIYVNRPDFNGNLPDDFPGLEGVERTREPPQWVRDLYGDTHGFVIDFSDQWYGMLVPKAKK
jgi:hypothetical protein